MIVVAVINILKAIIIAVIAGEVLKQFDLLPAILSVNWQFVDYMHWILIAVLAYLGFKFLDFIHSKMDCFLFGDPVRRICGVEAHWKWTKSGYITNLRFRCPRCKKPKDFLSIVEIDRKKNMMSDSSSVIVVCKKCDYNSGGEYPLSLVDYPYNQYPEREERIRVAFFRTLLERADDEWTATHPRVIWTQYEQALEALSKRVHKSESFEQVVASEELRTVWQVSRRLAQLRKAKPSSEGGPDENPT